MTNDKLTKLVPAFKISEVMHAHILESAGRHHDGLVDHIRFLIAQGLKYQARLDANEERVLAEMLKPPRPRRNTRSGPDETGLGF
jgi:hypothetical protein